MATNTTYLGLIKPDRYDLVSRPDMNDNYDKIDAGVEENAAALAIVVNGDYAPQNITAGDYLFIKNHSTLASGGYHATANISSGGAVVGSVTADSDGIANALNSKIAQVKDYPDKGTFSTLAGLETILNNALSSMGTYTSYSFRVTASATVYPFENTFVYHAMLHKNSTTNYNYVILYPNANAYPLTGYCLTGGTWTYDRLVLNSKIATQTVTSSVHVSSTKGTISGLTAKRTGNVVALAFILTINTSIAVDNSLGCTATFDDASLKPAVRQPGSTNIKYVSGINIDATTSGANLNAVANTALSSGNTMWLTFTYICAG